MLIFLKLKKKKIKVYVIKIYIIINKMYMLKRFSNITKK